VSTAANLNHRTKFVLVAILTKSQRLMKTASDPRHKRREKAIRSLFKWSFQNEQKIKNKFAQAVLKKVKRIDEIIRQSAPEWPIAQINKIDLAILRLAIYELVISQKEPPKVVIDEAVELAKAYGSEKSSAFINGVLGTVYKNHFDEKQKDAQPKEAESKTGN